MEKHELRKDPYYRKIMKTRNELIDTGDYGRKEATEAANHTPKFLLNRLFDNDAILQNDRMK